MRFVACDFISGRVIGEYPFSVTQSLERKISTYKSGELVLPILDEMCPPNWFEALSLWRTMILACSDDYDIMWAGVLDTRQIDQTAEVTYQVVTPEKYLDRRYCPNFNFKYKQDGTTMPFDQMHIAEELVKVCNEPVGAGGANFLIDTDNNGFDHTRYRIYYSYDDEKIYQKLQEMTTVDDGIEWTIDVVWDDEETKNKVNKVFRARYPFMGSVKLLPNSPEPDPNPNPEWEFVIESGVNSPVMEFTHERSMSDGNVATHVMSSGLGQESGKYYSDPVIDTYREQTLGYPRLEERFAFPDIDSNKELGDLNVGAYNQIVGGFTSIELTASINEWPRPIVDVGLGDQVRITVNLDQLKETSIWRVVGYSIDFSNETWKPLLARTVQDYEDGGIFG